MTSNLELLIALYAGGASLIGGLLAAFLNRAFEHNQWKRDQKLKAYTGYLTAYRHLQNAIGGLRETMPDVLRAEDPDDKAKVLVELENYRVRMTEAGTQNLTLIAPHDVAYWQHQLENNAVAFLSAMQDPNTLDWEAWRHEEDQATYNLTMHMRRDLGFKWSRWSYGGKKG